MFSKLITDHITDGREINMKYLETYLPISENILVLTSNCNKNVHSFNDIKSVKVKTLNISVCLVLVHFPKIIKTQCVLILPKYSIYFIII